MGKWNECIGMWVLLQSGPGMCGQRWWNNMECIAKVFNNRNESVTVTLVDEYEFRCIVLGESLEILPVESPL